MTASQITRDAIGVTAAKIAPHIRRTPVITIDAADFGLTARPLVLKLEFLQHTGSFKARGAFASLLYRDIPAAGVAAASGGNHGAAVAFAASRLGVPAHIFVPSGAPASKTKRIESYGATLIAVGAEYAEALAACDAHIARTGALSIHAYDAVETLLGQGTVGCELSEQSPGLDTLLVAVGGGGLIGGIAACYRGSIKIVAVEPKRAPTLHAARAAGRPVDVAVSGIAADALGARRIGMLAFDIAREHVAEAVLVSDEAIRSAQSAIWDKLRIVLEPGGAAAFSALLSRAYIPGPGERVGVLLCGANTTAVSL